MVIEWKFMGGVAPDCHDRIARIKSNRRTRRWAVQDYQ
jgi:hypothetical protein